MDSILHSCLHSVLAFKHSFDFTTLAFFHSCFSCFCLTETQETMCGPIRAIPSRYQVLFAWKVVLGIGSGQVARSVVWVGPRQWAGAIWGQRIQPGKVR